jgi:GLPGLI family protein
MRILPGFLPLPLLLLLLPAAAAAQEGRVTYDHAVQYDFEMPAGRGAGARGGDGAGQAARPALPPGVPTENYASVVLHFNATESVMRRIVEEEPEGVPTVSNQRMAGMATRLRMISTSRTDHETLLAAYADNADGSLTESVEFMGRTFLIIGTRPEWEWRLAAEQHEFMGYMVQKAVAVHDSSTIEAWFAPEIPVSAGPGSYGGLPGLILVLSVDSGHELYSATEIDLSGLEEGVITRPEEGEQMSREEYEGLVEEKLEEVGTMRSQRRIR